MVEKHDQIVRKVKSKLLEKGRALTEGKSLQEEGDSPGWTLHKSGPLLFLSFADAGIADTQIVVNSLDGQMTVRRQGRIQLVDENAPLEMLPAEQVKIDATTVYAALGGTLSYMDMSTYLLLFAA